ncbi:MULTISPECIES: hypothetical protein [unclassified Sphingobacterium]|uniref:hypothetical protein n=1 Tax=unclassified Sphingobacterium TaxID=2609468 RepID=UPI0025F2DB9B|nr:MULTISPECIES: hypothetical protein [unclassified Sphingobacterium]
MNYIEKKISINKAMAILAKNGIHVNEEETVTILDFLYLMAKYYCVDACSLDAESLRRNRTLEKR